MAGRPAQYNEPDSLDAAVEEYFNTDGKKTITGLAYFLGFESRQSFYDYEEKPEFSYIIKRARLRVEMGYEEALTSNNCTGSIFALKNMGWKDKTEQDLRVDGGVILTGIRPKDNATVTNGTLNGGELLLPEARNGKDH